MGATVTAVENAIGKVAPPRTVMSAEAASAYEEQLIQMAKAESLAMARKKEVWYLNIPDINCSMF